VNWLAFLAKYQLHGILCDGMGHSFIGDCHLLTQYSRICRYGAGQNIAIYLYSCQ
jgi:hypothetical protein